MRKLLSAVLVVLALLSTGLALLSPAAQAADTGNAAPQTGRIVSDEPGRNTPNILDGTVYSIAKVGNTIVVGGQFSTVNSGSGTPNITRNNVFAFDATSGKVSSTFAPNPFGTIYKVLPAADGKSVYVAGSSGRLFKINVSTGVVDPTFNAVPISGDIRDLELVGNHLFIAGKFTHINGVAQKALGTVYADTGKRDPYFDAVLAGLHNPNLAGAITDVLQISVNRQNTQLMAVGNFMTVADPRNTTPVDRVQIAKFDIGNLPSTIDTSVHQTLNPWSTTLFVSGCSPKFETNMTDVEYSPDGSYFAVSTTGAWGGSASNSGNSGCDVVARFENSSTAGATATWTAYTGGDTTWTVEVTDNVIYAGGHQRWQNNPSAGDAAGQGAVSREGIAALDPVNGMPWSWNPTRARGVGVQDMLATSDGLYVGSDTELLGHTAGNTYHARIGLLPLAGSTKLPVLQGNTLPADVYKVASGASQLTRRSFTGTTAGTSSNVPTGPGWGTSTGAFMANGVLYKVNNDGTVSKMSFDGTTYGASAPVATADAIVFQTDWHTDAKTLTSLFYDNGRIYYTKSGTNALYRRGFEIEDDVVGQQRFSTTTGSVNWSNVRGAFVAGGKLYFALTNGNLYSATWSRATHNVTSAATQVTGAGTGWASRAMFPYQGVPGALNEAPVANASVSCNALQCSFSSAGSSDPENGALTYDWDFGDGSPHATNANPTHAYATPGDRAVTLTVTDDKGATSSITRTASPSNDADPVSFVGSRTNSGSRSSHTITAPTGTVAGDTLLLFIAGNSNAPNYNAPAGWTQVQSEVGSSFEGALFTKKATSGDIGTPITVTTTNPTDGTAYVVKSDLTIAAYRGTGTPAISVSASTSQSFSSSVHQTPVIDAPDGTGWLVSYWSDKSTTATGTPTNWTGPGTQTQRSEGTGSGSSHMSSLLMDSNAPVGKGVEGGLNATADGSNQGLTMSVLLSRSGPPPANQPPTAIAKQTSCTDLTCSFDGGSSTDPEGGTLSYDWDWGDNTTHGTTATPSHTFAAGGNQTVTLTVKDPQNATASTTVTATPTDPVPNNAPVAHITGASCTDLVCSADGSTSSDPDADALTYDWNWGDGSGHDTVANPSHTYASAAGAPYTVTLTVDDGHGHTATDTTTLSPTPPPNTAPTAHITNVTCTGLTCSFDGSTSTDPDNDPLGYSWDFGDGSPPDTTAKPSHTYADAGARTVVLTVDDGNGHTATDTTPVNPTAAPVSHVAFVGATSKQNTSTSTTTTVTIPSGVQAGDTLVGFFTGNTTTPTYSGPTGWTQLESRNGTSIAVRAWTKTATGSESGTKVSVTSDSGAKTDFTVAIYRGTDGTTPVATSASATDGGGATHTSPAVTAADDTSWLLTYWADKSDNTTGWTAPAGQTVRQAVPTIVSTAHVTSLLTDGNQPVPSGANGQLVATANSTSAKGASVSILLKSN